MLEIPFSDDDRAELLERSERGIYKLHFYDTRYITWGKLVWSYRTRGGFRDEYERLRDTPSVVIIAAVWANHLQDSWKFVDPRGV